MLLPHRLLAAAAQRRMLRSLAGAGAGAAEGLRSVDATLAPKHQQPCHCIHPETIMNPGHWALAVVAELVDSTSLMAAVLVLWLPPGQGDQVFFTIPGYKMQVVRSD